MTDYTEIIDALRHCAEDGFDSCDACPYAAAPESCAGLAKKAAEAIEKLSAADVRPVVRGKWEPGDRRNVTAVCSNCGHLRLGNGAEWATKIARFCEKCGADMRPEPPKEESYGV